MADSLPVTFRVADTADAGLIVAMLEELVDELSPGPGAPAIKAAVGPDIAQALRSRDVRIFVAEQGGQAVGLSRADILHHDPIFRLRDDHRCGYVDQMYVRAPFRDGGLGAQLLRLCEEWFRARGLKHVLLHAAPRAARFYARVGYQPNREMYKQL